MLEDPAFPYQCHIGYGSLEIYPAEVLSSPEAASEVPDYALNQDELILDHIYDIPALEMCIRDRRKYREPRFSMCG